MKRECIRQGRTSSARFFLIEDLLTGALDGWYFGEANARSILEWHQREKPDGWWMLLEGILVPTHEIPDHRWHLDVPLAKQPKGGAK